MKSTIQKIFVGGYLLAGVLAYSTQLQAAEKDAPAGAAPPSAATASAGKATGQVHQPETDLKAGAVALPHASASAFVKDMVVIHIPMPPMRVLGKIEGPLASSLKCCEIGIGTDATHLVIGQGGLTGLSTHDWTRIKACYDAGMVMAFAYPTGDIIQDAFKVLEPTRSFPFRVDPDKPGKFNLYAWRKIPKGLAEIAFTEINAKEGAGEGYDYRQFMLWVRKPATFDSHFTDNHKLAFESLPKDKKLSKVRTAVEFLEEGGDIALLNPLDLLLSARYLVTSEARIFVRTLALILWAPGASEKDKQENPPFVGQQQLISPANNTESALREGYTYSITELSIFLCNCVPAVIDTLGVEDLLKLGLKIQDSLPSSLDGALVKAPTVKAPTSEHDMLYG